MNNKLDFKPLESKATGVWDSGLQEIPEVNSCSKVEKPTISISLTVLRKVFLLMQEYQQMEWAADLISSRNGNEIHITDLAVFTQDEVDIFLEECCKLTDKKFTGKEKLYKSYLNWCTENSLTPLNKIKFEGLMINKGFNNKITGAGRRWSGIELTPKKAKKSDKNTVEAEEETEEVQEEDSTEEEESIEEVEENEEEDGDDNSDDEDDEETEVEAVDNEDDTEEENDDSEKQEDNEDDSEEQDDDEEEETTTNEKHDSKIVPKKRKVKTGKNDTKTIKNKKSRIKSK